MEAIRLRASQQDGSYPRPQLLREEWTSLDGEWQFSFDDEDRGVAERWFAVGGDLGRRIRVPFAPEAAASGIGDTGFHAIAWYRRAIEGALDAGRRRILHFGAVDHSCRVWIDGTEVGSHVGGQTPFALDITDALRPGREHEIVVRAYDDPHDLEVPRGKQDWELEPHHIWYPRTTGIWQTVWWEDVPDTYVSSLAWTSDLATGTVTVTVAVAGARRSDDLRAEVRLENDGAHLATASATLVGGRARIVLAPPQLSAGQARRPMHWSPEHPELFDAEVRLLRGDATVDRVASYCATRSVAVADGTFQLNGLPYFLRSVLEQGIWPDSLLTAPDDDARRREVELIKALGFNAARIHQKVEDPRFLFWADRLGLLLWGETAAAYDFTPRAVELLTNEWLRIVARDRSHPSIVPWVPVHECWGVPDIARDPAQRAFARALADLTRAADPTRPVLSNDGWEHVDSDMLTIHDYTTDAAELASRYSSSPGRGLELGGIGPYGRVLSVSPEFTDRIRTAPLPIIVSEFGGISFDGEQTWGYATVADLDAYREALRGLFAAVGESSVLGGFCYTQLTDTFQEANGLLTADREPKLPIGDIRRIVLGERDATGP